MSFGVAGCAFLNPKADPTHFYILRAQTAPPAAAARHAATPPEIRVGPGQIADYLQNIQIALQKDSNRVEYLDLFHWAEPLSKGISRVLAENLARRFDVVDLTVYPNPPLSDSAYDVRYTVEQFEGTLNGPVTLAVSWQVVQPSSGKAFGGKRATYSVPVQGKADTVSAYVERLSLALDEWAEDVAVVIASP
jgi:uncharacterized lipoprotein YmbA